MSALVVVTAVIYILMTWAILGVVLLPKCRVPRTQWGAIAMALLSGPVVWVLFSAFSLKCLWERWRGVS